MVTDAHHDDFTSERAIACLKRLQRYDPSVSIQQIADAIDDGSAILFPNASGFSVLRIEGENLHIWITAMYNGHSENLLQVVTDIVLLAQLMKLKAVTFSTTRKGWQRVAKRIGFMPVGNNIYKRST